MLDVIKKEREFSSVLFVDDELNILSSIRRAVMDEEYVTYFASSGAEALKIMEKSEISVIVTDMKMPGMDGLQLLKIVKEKYPNIVKIVLSGYTQLSQVLATVNQADIFNFITKPWDMEVELKYVIRKAIEHHQLKKNEIQLKINLEKRNVAYQNVLKKMETNSNSRTRQMLHVKKIADLLLQTIERQKENETHYLVKFLSDYIERIPVEMDRLLVENMVERVRLFIADNPRYCQDKLQISQGAVGSVQGSYEMICFPITCLLDLLSQSPGIESVYIYIKTKEEGGKVVLSFCLFFLDTTGSYEKKLSPCSYQLAEKLFREIMSATFITGRNKNRQLIQLEFSLDRV